MTRNNSNLPPSLAVYTRVMSSLTIAQKTFLEAVLNMRTGYVLDFTDGSFATFFTDLNIDIYDSETFSSFGTSKANRLRALWKVGSDTDVSVVLSAFADYIEAKHSLRELRDDVNEEQIAKIREFAHSLGRALSNSPARGVTPITTEATVTKNKISIEIHEDIYNHIKRNLETSTYFHAVEESYKLVREKLRELTGYEKASEVFNQAASDKAHHPALFGKSEPETRAEGDFFRGIGYLHLGVQFLRNEKAHTPATPLEPNLALHYISLASLAYDLITRYVSEEAIQTIEGIVHTKRVSYQSASAFYREFKNGNWIRDLSLPGAFDSTSMRKALKKKWLAEADFTQSFDHSNLMLMRLELVVDELTASDIDRLLGLPTTDSYGNDQLAGMEQFLEFVGQQDSDKISSSAEAWIAAHG